MIHIPGNITAKQAVLVGDPTFLSNPPSMLWDTARLSFLADLSKILLAMDDVRELPDVVAFAFWARRANLKALKKQFYGADTPHRIGLGLTFHICPANTPINAAFTLAFGLIAGNSCVLRLPSEDTPTTDYLIRGLNNALAMPEHAALKDALMLIRYGHDDDVTAFWMAEADGRVMWGGDATIQKMRQFDARPRSREIVFSDRYSCSLIDAKSVLNLDDDALAELARQLYNDIYTMDQAACSSPQLVAWTGDANSVTNAQEKLWSAVAAYAETHYTSEPAQIMDKFVNACNSAIENSHINRIIRHNNILYRFEQNELNSNQDHCRGYSGTIHEVTLSSLEELGSIVNESYQTLTYFGYKSEDILAFVHHNRLRGIDRIVPIGQALDMGILWDGHQMITSLSRIIDVS